MLNTLINAAGFFQDESLPSKHQQQREHLLGYPQRAVEPCPNHFQGMTCFLWLQLRLSFHKLILFFLFKLAKYLIVSAWAHPGFDFG